MPIANKNTNKHNEKRVQKPHADRNPAPLLKALLSKARTRHGRLALILAALVVAAAVLYGTLFAFIIFKSDAVALLRGQFGTEIQKEQELRALKQLFLATESDRYRLDQFFITPDTIVRFIEQVESIGEHAGVAVSFTTVDIDEGAAVLTVHLETGGDFHDTYYFLSLLESLPFKLAFREISINKRTERELLRDGVIGTWRGVFNVALLSFIPDK